MISSGDNEPHSHPRPDALGATGKFGRGNRPLIFSTELARSPVTMLERPEKIRAGAQPQLDEAKEEANATGASPEEHPEEVAGRFQRAIAVYGLITMRTDGTNVVVAQKLEQRRGAEEFDYYCLEPGSDGLAWNANA